jgi:Prolipoprotein diacylglyceryl transferase
MATRTLAFIPSPPVSGFHLGPLFVHFYGLMYVAGIALAIYITRRRWAAGGGDPGLVQTVALMAVPAGLIGARIYFDITTPFDITPGTPGGGRWPSGTAASACGAASRPARSPGPGRSGGPAPA